MGRQAGAIRCIRRDNRWTTRYSKNKPVERQLIVPGFVFEDGTILDLKLAFWTFGNSILRVATLCCCPMALVGTRDWAIPFADSAAHSITQAAMKGAFPIDALREVGYEAAWQGQRSWTAFAILAKGAEPVVIRTELPGDPSDRQARYIEAAVSGVVIASIYLPNGNPQPGPKFNHKLAWFDRLIAHAAELWAADLRFRQKASLLRVAGTADFAQDFLEAYQQVAISVAFLETSAAFVSKLDGRIGEWARSTADNRV